MWHLFLDYMAISSTITTFTKFYHSFVIEVVVVQDVAVHWLPMSLKLLTFQMEVEAISLRWLLLFE